MINTRTIANLALMVGFLMALLSACHQGGPTFRNAYASAEVDCRSAATILRRSAQGTPQMAPPLWRIRACPERAGVLIAMLLDTSRHVADTAELEHRTWLTQHLHDSRILEAALRVAGDATAQPMARVAAIRTLIWQKSPGQFLPFRQMISNRHCFPPGCKSTYEGHFYGPINTTDATGSPVFGRRPFDSYAIRIDSILISIAREPGTDALVRGAAEAALRFPMAEELKERRQRARDLTGFAAVGRAGGTRPGTRLARVHRDLVGSVAANFLSVGRPPISPLR